MGPAAILAASAALGWGQALVLLAIGLAAGVLGGLLGIGGGLVMIPAMVLVLDEPFGAGSLHVYKLASIAASVVVAVPASLRHLRARAVVPAMVASTVPASLLGVVVGVAAASLFAGEQTHVLRRIFGAFMLATVAFGYVNLGRRADADRTPRRACPVPRRWVLIGSLVGLPSGLIAGLLGIGGGVWSVPMMNLGLGVRLRYAIANSACMIVFVALGTSAVQSVTVSQMAELHALDGWKLTLWLAPGALAGGWIGAGLTQRLSVGWLRVAVDVLLTLTGLRLLV